MEKIQFDATFYEEVEKRKECISWLRNLPKKHMTREELYNCVSTPDPIATDLVFVEGTRNIIVDILGTGELQKRLRKISTKK